jgi:cationic peptide transport system substrate-binding protein
MFLLPVCRKILSVAFFAALTAGCTQDDLYVKDYLKQNGIVFCTNSNISNLDPLSNEINVTSVTLAQNVFNRLIRFDSASNRYLPEIASEWSISEDRTAYRFILNRNIPFQKTSWFMPMRTLNADDVLFSFARIMDYTNPYEEVQTQENSTTQASYDILDFRHLVQAKQIIKRINKIDSYTVEFILTSPNTHFLEFISNTNCTIESKEFFDSIPETSQKEEYFRNHPVGTGPFTITEFKFNDYVILKQNKDYWKKEEMPKLNKLVIDITPNRAHRMNKMITGECQVTNQPSKAVTKQDNTSHNFEILGSDTFDSTVIFFNTSRGPMENRKVRHLIASAVNHEVYGNVLYPHAAMLPTSLLPFDVTFFSTIAHQDIATLIKNMDEQVRKRLRSNNIVYVYIERSNSKMGYNISRLTQLIRSDLSSLGIRARVREVDSKSLARLVSKGAYDIIVTRGVYPMKMPLYKLYVSFSCTGSKPVVSNYSAYCNKELTDLMGQYRYKSLKNIDIEHLQQINSHLEKDIPMFPISFASDYFIYHRDVHGLKRAINNGLDFSETYLR